MRIDLGQCRRQIPKKMTTDLWNCAHFCVVPQGSGAHRWMLGRHSTTC